MKELRILITYLKLNALLLTETANKSSGKSEVLFNQVHDEKLGMSFIQDMHEFETMHCYSVVECLNSYFTLIYCAASLILSMNGISRLFSSNPLLISSITD